MVLGLFDNAGETAGLPPGRFAIWLGAAVAFAVAFWITSGAAIQDKPSVRNVALLAVQPLAALMMYEIVCTGLETMLLDGVPIGCFPDLYGALAGNMPDQVITL